MKKWMCVWLAGMLLTVTLWGCGGGKSVQLGGETVAVTAEELVLTDPQQLDVENLSKLAQLKKLDLRQLDVALKDYEALAAALPECEILWRVPFQGEFLDADTTGVYINGLEAEDITALRYLTKLTSIEVEDNSDDALIAAIREAFPDCALRCRTVVLGGEKYDADTQLLEVENVDCQELMNALTFLPEVKTVSFAGVIPENEAIYALKEAYPETAFLWDFQLCGVTVNSGAAEIDLSDIPMESVEEVEQSLKYFNDLQKVVMCNCGISSEEMDALWKRHPETRFVWSVKIGVGTVRTDVTGYIPYKYGYASSGTLHNKECKEMKYLTDLVCLDLGHMQVKDLSFLEYMPNLEYLLLCGNGISDISPISHLKKLKYVELFQNNITDISPLAECPLLEDINLCYCRVADVTPLLELENINNLWFTSMYLEEDQIQILKDNFSDIDKLLIHPGRSTSEGWRDLPNYFAQRDVLGMWYMVTPKYK